MSLENPSGYPSLIPNHEAEDGPLPEIETVVDPSLPDPAGWDRELRGPFPRPTEESLRRLLEESERRLRRDLEESDRAYRQGLARLLNDHTPFI